MRHRSVACSSTGSLVDGRTHMSRAARSGFVSGPAVDRGHLPASLGVFFCAFCRSGSACPIAGPGLRNRKPNCRTYAGIAVRPSLSRTPVRSMPPASCPRRFAEASVDSPKGAFRSAVSTAPTVHPRAVRLAFVFEPADPILDRFSVAPPNCAAFRRRHIMTRQ